MILLVVAAAGIRSVLPESIFINDREHHNLILIFNGIDEGADFEKVRMLAHSKSKFLIISENDPNNMVISPLLHLSAETWSLLVGFENGKLKYKMFRLFDNLDKKPDGTPLDYGLKDGVHEAVPDAKSD